MQIYGNTVVLRGIEQDDNQMLLDLINDPETEKMLGGSSWPLTMRDQLNWFSNLSSNDKCLRCVIAIKEDPTKAVGTIILNEIDYKNGTAHIHIKLSANGGRGRGYGTDSINTLTKYAFNELRLNCIYANILTYNEASVKLFEKCGYKRDGVLRSRVYKNGNFYDVYAYSIIQNDLK